MFCGKCGAALPESSMFCNLCGQAVGGQVVPAVIPQPAVAAPITTPLPDAATSGKALASMITGIFGLLFFLPAFAAIILGHISRSEIQKSNGRLKGKGMSTAGLVMGYGVIALLPFMLILAAIAIPNLLRARIAANESSALASIRTINTAQVSYQSAYPAVGFACQLEYLGGTNASAPDANHAQFIDNALASGQKHGYRFAVENCVNSEGEHKYEVVANPVTRNQTGMRSFCSDESGIIRVGKGGPATNCLETGTPLE